MLPLQFFGQNFHFAASLFAALATFAAFWLYFDAWIGRRETKGIFKWAGFLLISISFLTHVTIIEQSVLGGSIFGNVSETFAIILRLFGYLVIIYGQIIDPLQPAPETKGLELKGEKSPGFLPPLAGAATITKLILPFASLAAGLLYLRRATVGFEKHLRLAAIAFFSLTAFEIFSLASLLRNTDNPIVYDLSAPFGPLWIAEHVFLIAGAAFLTKWVWYYLVRRLQSQLFIIFTVATAAIFLVTTVSFTFLLMRNVQQESLANLETAASVLNYAIDSKKAETLANAQVAAQNPEIIEAVKARNHNKLVSLTGDFLKAKKTSSLVITGSSGQILLRAEDPERWGESISEEPLAKRALIGEVGSSIVSKEDVLAPLIFIRSATPIKDNGKKIVGVAMVGLVIDDAFVDGIKNATGLDSAIYADNARSTTTFLAPDGKSRWVGVREESGQVREQVLEKGETFKGSLNVLNRPFLAVYVPLRDVDNTVVGMMFIGKPQVSILRTAGRSVEITFLVAVVLLMISIVPAYLISRHIAKQIR